MADENQPSKKRAAGRELSRDNPGLDDDEDVPQEMGTFKKASDEVLAGRRIVKVRRQQTSSAPSAPSSNPFAGICLVPSNPTATPANANTEGQAAEDKTAGEDPDTKDETNSEAEVESKEPEEKHGHGEAAVESNEDKEKAALADQAAVAADTAEKESIDEPAQDDKADGGDTAKNDPETESTDKKEGDGSAEKTAEAEPAGDKEAEGDKTENNDKEQDEKSDGSGSGAGGSLSSFQQLSNSQNAFTGLSGTGFSSSTFSFGSLQKDGSTSQSSLPTFSFGTPTNGSTPLFGTSGSSLGSKSEGSAFRAMPEVPRETGEENEETVFSADSALFEFFDGGWKERGKGEVKVNVLKGDTQKARLVMRAKGNLRLILNASLFPDMKLTKMDKKGITFACVNIANEGKDSLSTFALKFKDVSIVEEFSSIVSAHKDKPAAALKTPENSPKAPDV